MPKLNGKLPTSINLDPDIEEALKRYCAHEDESMAKIVRKAIKLFLMNNDDPDKSWRDYLRRHDIDSN